MRLHRLSFLLLALPTAALGCNFAQLHPAPDAAPACTAPQLEFPCEPGPVTTPGCNGDLNSLAALGTEVIIDAGSYPVGCTVIVNASVTDQDNQCSTIGTCHCAGGGDAGAFNWVCVE